MHDAFGASGARVFPKYDVSAQRNGLVPTMKISPSKNLGADSVDSRVCHWLKIGWVNTSSHPIRSIKTRLSHGALTSFPVTTSDRIHGERQQLHRLSPKWLATSTPKPQNKDHCCLGSKRHQSQIKHVLLHGILVHRFRCVNGLSMAKRTNSPAIRRFGGHREKWKDEKTAT